MRFINLSDISGMEYLAQDVISSSGRLLAKKGLLLNSTLVEKIKQNNIHSAYVTDELSEGIIEDLGSVEDFYLKDIIDPNIRHTYNLKIRESFKKFKETKVDSRYSDSGTNLFKTVYEISDDIITNLLSGVEHNVSMLDIKSLDTYDYAHSVNTAVLSVLTGIKLGLREKELEHLSMGSLLMNIGKELIDSAILKKETELEEYERILINSHSELGRRILNDRSTISAYVKNIVYNHHERLDGSGYPRGLKGQEVDKLTRIVMISDVYDAMTSDRSYRPAHVQQEALEYIMGNSRLFDMEIARVFSQSIVIYPMGSYVKLSNGSIGMVIGQNKQLPLRPKVRIIMGRRLREIIDLARETNITILHTVKKLES